MSFSSVDNFERALLFHLLPLEPPGDSEFLGNSWYTIQVFLFVDPTRDPRGGRQLLELPITQVRLRTTHRVVVQWCNIHDERECQRAIEKLYWVYTEFNQHKPGQDLASLDYHPGTSESAAEEALALWWLSKTSSSVRLGTQGRRVVPGVRTRFQGEIHVWSIGGDRTLMVIYKHLQLWGVDRLSGIYFSQLPAVPFEDFGRCFRWLRPFSRQAWSGPWLSHFSRWIRDRLNGTISALDVWSVEIETWANGYVERLNYSDTSSTSKRPRTLKLYMRTVLAVGSPAYTRRVLSASKRPRDAYDLQRWALREWIRRTPESRFRPVNLVLQGIEQGDEVLLNFHTPNSTASSTIATNRGRNSVNVGVYRPSTWVPPELTFQPCALVVQNLPQLWDDLLIQRSKVKYPYGASSPEMWTYPSAGDGKLEIYGLENPWTNCARANPARKRCVKLLQVTDGVILTFRNPRECRSHSGQQEEAGITSLPSSDIAIPKETDIYVDGEQYQLHLPRLIRLQRKQPLWMLNPAKYPARPADSTLATLCNPTLPDLVSLRGKVDDLPTLDG
ncbi:hypothetical protein IWQ61_001369 [Dispira simplex]|nr:hypothetical protein IWQ61_001369 [Dispira simplex]